MTQLKGKSCKVLVADRVDQDRNYSQVTLASLLALSEHELATIDPLAMNLIIAKGIPSLAQLDIAGYQSLVNLWARDFVNQFLPQCERMFFENPGSFRNDPAFFRLGAVCHYVEHQLGIEYNHDQRDAQSILYTDPSDLFLNGLLESREGTCGNMAALHLAFAWRLQWPVSLACVNSHFVVRYDDGSKQFNIEATQSGRGGFKSDPDEYLIREGKIPAKAISNGSDLKALTRKEIVAIFLGLRARHFQDVGIASANDEMILESEKDWLLARTLFPCSRSIYKSQMVVSALRGNQIFDDGEMGHPSTLSQCVRESQSLLTDWRHLAESVAANK